MFAQYTIQSKKNKLKFLGISALYLTINLGKVKHKIDLEELKSVLIERRRKLAPLLAGGIITSLSLLSMILYSSSFELIGLIAFGLLLTYFGMTEYTVFRLEYANVNELVWMPVTVTLDSVRPFIAIIEFYINRRQFPILYASPVAPEDHNLIHFESSPVRSQGTIIYLFGKSPDNAIPQVAINPALLDHAIEVDGQGKVIAEGHFLINHTAIIDSNSINLS